MTQYVLRRLIKSLLAIIICLLWGLFIVSCSKHKIESLPTSTLIVESTITHTPTPSPSRTISPPPTHTQTPSATPDISPKLITTLGKGIVSEVTRSPDGSLESVIEGNLLHWFDAANGNELGSIDLGTDFLGDILISNNNRWILVEAGLGASFVEHKMADLFQPVSAFSYIHCVGIWVLEVVYSSSLKPLE
jgi:hypothetical protein